MLTYNMLKSKKFWGIVTSFLFFVLALRGIDFAKLPTIISNISWSYLLLIFLSTLLEHYTRAVRWKALLYGKELTIKNSFYATVLGYFFNNLLPARAGEFIKAWFLKNKGAASAGEALGSVVIERFLDGILTLGLMCFSLNLFASNPLIERAAWITLFFYAIVLIFIISVFFWQKKFNELSKKIFSLLPERFSKILDKSFNAFMDGLVLFAGNKKAFILSIVWTIISWTATFLTIGLWCKMFDLKLDFSGISFILIVLAIGSMIPSSPGNLGIYEYSCVLALHNVLGYSSEIAASFGIISHIIGYIFIAIEGFTILTLENISVKEIQNSSNLQK